ncbi:aminotransferase V [Methanoculleus taiwanensis]|uniref:cysteine desulfurase n=2 Tax=Methanoculleus taiwanensis TaxID=1550565 RepID=A0A498H2I6_9EURY|nr:aminotransferase V [Methanoculleus taiwanensis]
MRERRALCGICSAGCGVIVTYDDEGKIAGVRADEDSEIGIICKLGERTPEIVYSKDRVIHPLKRVGPKGTYAFERISWDEAYAIIVENLTRIKDEHGPEAAAIYTGSGSFELSHCDVFQPKDVAVSSASSVLFPYGSPNTMGVGALCYVAFAMIAPHVTMGRLHINTYSDFENADLIVVWGTNPATDFPPLNLRKILAAKSRGAEVVVIDPRRTKTVDLAGAEWVPIRPGTDGALALGLCNVLIAEELYDEEFVKNWTHGFAEFSTYVQHFRPEVVEEITGIPAETVLSLARRIAAADGATWAMYTGLEYSDSGVQAIRAAIVLWALAGQMDVPGGRCFSMLENTFPINRSEYLENPDLNRAIGVDRFPVYTAYRQEAHPIALPESVLHGRPYKVRALIIQAGHLLISWPQTPLWRETLENLEFLVCVDRTLTADAAYADIVLPATTMYERESYMTYGPLFRIREKVIEPLGEARHDVFIMAELAKHLGYGHLYPQDEEAMLRHVLKGSGFSLEAVRAAGGTVQSPTVMMQYKKWEKGLLRPDGKPGFDTPTGKFEIWSTILEESGYDPLPVYTEPQESPVSRPDVAETYPLIFNSGARVTTDFHAQHHGVESLIRERPEPTVTIHSRDAEERGIRNGDRVTVRTLRGQIPLRAIVTDDIVRGAIEANMGGGCHIGPKAWQEGNVNELTDMQRYDPISGFPVYKVLLCDVTRADTSGGETVAIGSGELGAPRDLPAAAATSETARIYLDNNATTPIDPAVWETMVAFGEANYGNPSSIYREGKAAKRAVEDARRVLARLLGCTAKRIVFTGCCTEANNFLIKGLAFASRDGENKHLITSSVEHSSVLEPIRWLRKFGFTVTELSVDATGRVSPADLAEAITAETLLVSIMTANNETGSIQPIRELARVAHASGALFHTDATQAIGKIPVNVADLDVDFLSLSAHKIYGPKGVGALYIRKGIELDPLLHGGEQERGLRAGTENVLGIVGLGRAAELAEQHLAGMEAVRLLRDRLEDGIRALVPEARLNGHPTERLPNTVNMTLPGYRGESVVLALDQQGISISSGSACHSGSPAPSHVLRAMGLSDEEVHCSIRISLGAGTTEEEVERTLAVLDDTLHNRKATVRFVTCR